MNKLGIKVEDFLKIYGSFLFESIRGYLLGSKRKNDVSNIKVSRYLKFEELDNKVSPKVSVEDREVSEFILSNIDSSVGLIVAFEEKFGNLGYKQDMRVFYNALRVSAGDIILAIGASRESDREIVKIRNSIIAFYEKNLIRLKNGEKSISFRHAIRKSIVSRKSGR
ncbi:hypothetical protein F0310_04545 (plasmid) [Borrelia sp. A-FGy1]|uniref:hypothetical protein n=1 Tax=Borrelia sp. A-FGy1 TaxID=2608247 RepID=UPI0015F54175|nr:hypothetical protein [Borrelia sp. A-FGy1]QMU99687.1 hypothetical protein F0310_04545 [Borrelia sp. A-FGy1]